MSPYITRLLSFLGAISYSLYLLHPLIYDLTGLVFKASFLNTFGHRETFRLLLAIILTFGLSAFTYYFYESYFIKVGRNLSQKLVKRENERNTLRKTINF